MRFKRRHKKSDAELEITSFLNLMIILVPVLLVMMVFSRITVVDLKLPDLGDPSSDEEPTLKVEVIINKEYMDVNLTSQFSTKRYDRVEKKEGEYDYQRLSLALQQLKRDLKQEGIDKRDALILSQEDTDYQVLISTIDTVRSFKAVVVTDVVDAELFPAIALGDAPIDTSANNTDSGSAL
jgi:biopolymer transport protein ExbD